MAGGTAAARLPPHRPYAIPARRLGDGSAARRGPAARYYDDDLAAEHPRRRPQGRHRARRFRRGRPGGVLPAAYRNRRARRLLRLSQGAVPRHARQLLRGARRARRHRRDDAASGGARRRAGCRGDGCRAGRVVVESAQRFFRAAGASQAAAELPATVGVHALGEGPRRSLLRLAHHSRRVAVSLRRALHKRRRRVFEQRRERERQDAAPASVAAASAQAAYQQPAERS